LGTSIRSVSWKLSSSKFLWVVVDLSVTVLNAEKSSESVDCLDMVFSVLARCLNFFGRVLIGRFSNWSGTTSGLEWV
jgi:hypothetical protein